MVSSPIRTTPPPAAGPDTVVPPPRPRANGYPSFIAASPPILIEAVAGLALLPSLAAALAGSLQAEDSRLPAILTFVTTASGVTVLGIGGAFWGLIAGIVLMLVLRRWRPS